MKGKPTKRPTSESSQPIPHGTASRVREREGRRIPRRTILQEAGDRNVPLVKHIRDDIPSGKYFPLLVSFHILARVAISAAAAAEGPFLDDECRGNYDCPGDQICAEVSSISQHRQIEGSQLGTLGSINFLQNIEPPERRKANTNPGKKEAKPDPLGKKRSNQVSNHLTKRFNWR